MPTFLLFSFLNNIIFGSLVTCSVDFLFTVEE